MLRNIIRIFSFVLLSALMLSCSWFECKEEFDPQNRRVMIVYSAGFNTISSFLKSDIEEMKTGYLPGNGVNDDILLVYSHFLGKTGLYSDQTSPTLARIYKDSKGKVVSDTLVTYPKGSISASVVQLNNVLTHIRDNFPAKAYGLVFSSHATGYLPVGYYGNSQEYEGGMTSLRESRSVYDPSAPVPYIAPESDPSLPMVKSIGEDKVEINGRIYSYQMDLADFAAAVPMHMEYIIFDACLMGGVEVAYQFRNVCDKLAFSPAEVLASGLTYNTLVKNLLGSDQPDVKKVCEEYFMQYDSQSGTNRSATTTMIDCSKLGTLTTVCKTLFDKYRAEINVLDPEKVQRYYREKYHWFYDLESILLNAGITEDEHESLTAAMEECILYKAATPSFMGGPSRDSFDIELYSGLSMFLPSDGGAYIKKFYKTLDWNKATGLVQ